MLLDWGNWFQSLKIDTKIALLSLVVVTMGVLISWYKESHKLGKQKNISQKTKLGDSISGNKIIQGDNVTGDKNIYNFHDITLEQYENGLEKCKVEVHAKLEKSHAEDHKLLKAELRDIRNALKDTKTSYETLSFSQKERIYCKD